MIKLFRSFNPLNIVWLAIFLFAMRIGFAYHVPEKMGFPFIELFLRLLIPVSDQPVIPPLFNLFLASALVFIQAILINYLVNHYNLLGKSTFLPALMYITVSGLFIPFLMLSPPLVCNFLVIWMLFKLFNLYKGDEAKSISYDLGMIVAIGTMIYLPFIYMLLVIWIALIIFRPFDWREWIACMIGFITIFFFLAVFYYLNDKLGQFFDIWLPLATKFSVHININYYNYLVLIPVIIILVFCFFTLQQNFFKSYVQTRKSFQLLFFVFLIALFSFYIRTEFHLDHFLLCAVPAAVFFAYYFLYARTRWFYETLYIILLASIIYFQFNTF
ncbi:MAG: beta-carotene 15,15-monooxygenase [Mucilaginibacter sp.]|nr:beta-carotene 15,15-monooxygenase [Mucilaginibacter sp.]